MNHSDNRAVDKPSSDILLLFADGTVSQDAAFLYLLIELNTSHGRGMEPYVLRKAVRWPLIRFATAAGELIDNGLTVRTGGGLYNPQQLHGDN